MVRNSAWTGIFLIILMVGCSAPQKTDSENLQAATCNKPYMKFAYSCCLDSNENKICDSDEEQPEEKPEIKDTTKPEVTKPDLPEAAPEKKIDFSLVKKSLALVEIVEYGETISGGIGFFVTDSYIITPMQNFEGFAKMPYGFINITDSNKISHRESSVISFNEEYDLALIKVYGANEKPIVFANESIVGETTYIFGFPYIDGFSLTKGIVSAKRESPKGEFLQTDAAFGIESGAPMFNSKGEFLGMMYSKFDPMFSEGLNFAMSFTTIEAFFKTSEIMKCTSSSDFQMKVDCPFDFKKFNSSIETMGLPVVLPDQEKFSEFTIKLKSSDEKNHSLCFRQITAKNMLNYTTEALKERVVVENAFYGKEYTIKAIPKKNDKSFIYYDIIAYECRGEGNVFEFYFGNPARG